METLAVTLKLKFVISEGDALVYALERQFAENAQINGDFYFTPSLNYLIDLDFKIYPLPVLSKYNLGNVSNIEYFANTPLCKSLSKTIINNENINKKAAETLSSYRFLTVSSL